MLAPWPRSVMVLNIALGLASLLLGGYILWQTSLPFFWLYLGVWVGVLTVGRYFVCRSCPYYGQDCPTYGWGHLTRLMYRQGRYEGIQQPRRHHRVRGYTCDRPAACHCLGDQLLRPGCRVRED